MRKEIIVPANIQVKILSKESTPEDPKTEIKEVTFADYLISNPLKNFAWGANLTTLEQREEFVKVIDMVPGDKLVVSFEAYKLLNELVNKPEKPYDPEIGAQILSFMRAIHYASAV